MKYLKREETKQLENKNFQKWKEKERGKKKQRKKNKKCEKLERTVNYSH